jgi:hypothetical protein
MLSYEIEILMIIIYNPLLTGILFTYILFKLVSGGGFYMKPSDAAPKTIKYSQIRNCN